MLVVQNNKEKFQHISFSWCQLLFWHRGEMAFWLYLTTYMWQGSCKLATSQFLFFVVECCEVMDFCCTTGH